MRFLIEDFIDKLISGSFRVELGSLLVIFLII